MIIVADTSPLRYLVLIDATHILPKMFETVLIPPTVAFELNQSSTPAPVRAWIANPPSWIRIVTPTISDPTLIVDPGEYEAILLAIEQHAPLLIDDRKGRVAAERRHVVIIGTLILLFDAGGLGLLDFTATVNQLLNQTNFRVPISLLETLFERDARRKRTRDE